MAANAPEQLVQLSVGGRPFTTTRTTLCAQGGMLAAMFGGTMEPTLLVDECGRFFIDRDSAPFATVLNFLRDGQAVLPADRAQLHSLRAEAAFYNLPGLADSVDTALAGAEAAEEEAHQRQLGSVKTAVREALAAEASQRLLPPIEAAVRAAVAEKLPVAKPKAVWAAVKEVQEELSSIDDRLEAEMRLCSDRLFRGERPPGPQETCGSRIELLKLSAKLAELKLLAATSGAGE